MFVLFQYLDIFQYFTVYPCQVFLNISQEEEVETAAALALKNDSADGPNEENSASAGYMKIISFNKCFLCYFYIILCFVYGVFQWRI